MSKATFVNEIPSKIEGNEVPTLNLVKSMIPEKLLISTTTQYGYFVEPPFILVDNPGTNSDLDSAKLIGIDSQYCSGEQVEITFEAFSDTITTHQSSLIATIKNGGPAMPSDFAEIEQGLFPLLGVSHVHPWIEAKIVSSKGLIQDFVGSKFRIEKGPTDMNSDKVMTANAVKGYVEGNKIKLIKDGWSSELFLLLCPIKETPTFFNGHILWSNGLFKVYIFCQNNQILFNQAMLLASQESGCGVSWRLYKVSTEEGDWVAFSPDQNTGTVKQYVYDYTSSDEIKIVNIEDSSKQITPI